MHLFWRDKFVIKQVKVLHDESLLEIKVKVKGAEYVNVDKFDTHAFVRAVWHIHALVTQDSRLPNSLSRGSSWNQSLGSYMENIQKCLVSMMLSRYDCHYLPIFFVFIKIIILFPVTPLDMFTMHLCNYQDSRHTPQVVITVYRFTVVSEEFIVQLFQLLEVELVWIFLFAAS